jgi:cytochrome c peroxidase
VRYLLVALAAWFFVIGAPVRSAEAEEEEEGDPPQVAVGERLFLETRFAQFFAANSGSNVNALLPAGDPVVATTVTTSGAIPGPFAGQSMNCRACHLVDDVKDTPGGGSRSYDDFARQSPIPLRDDGRTTTPRNSPTLVNASLARDRPFALHFDSEFPSLPALVKGTITGRNYGWLPTEQEAAVAQVARVVREDDGTGALAQSAGGGYRRVLAGTDPTIPKELRLPRKFRIDVDAATDAQILDAVARLVAAYVESLVFTQEDDGFTGSAYDRFLLKNHIPNKQDEFEPQRFYVQRLREFLANKDAPDFVTPADGTLMLHSHAFAFGAQELAGLRIFLDPKRGNCAACHIPPTFTDFGLHNTGVTQRDYDLVHGGGAFAQLTIPALATRSANPDAYLPATALHPNAIEPLRALPRLDDPRHADLGVWNIYQNPDFPCPPQRRLEKLVCASLSSTRSECRRKAPTPSARLDAAIGLFKTPGLRDLGHSGPYLHSGTLDQIEDVVRFYIDASAAARAGRLRNGARELLDMSIGEADVAPLSAFLRSLDEDYE